jgi:poly(hydroxyalkanoate) granule-associated protein
MIKKLEKLSADRNAGAQLAGSVKDSAQQIWLAGLGAFAKAQEEGGKVFETLVKEGLSIQRKTQSAAEERIAEATSRMTALANDISARATGKWDKLETIFQDRVAKALNGLGAPSARDMEALAARVHELEQRLEKRPAGAAAARAAAKGGAKPAAKRATSRTAAR